jgi:hypothetical protein
VTTLLACPRCHRSLTRTTRTWLQRLLYRRLLCCAACGFEVPDRRLPFKASLRFLASSHSRCIECGTTRVRRLPARDSIDRMSRHPLSLLFGLTFAPIYHCGRCRLQYRDWRRAPAAEPLRGVASPYVPPAGRTAAK